MRGRAALAHGDQVGAILDVVRFMQRYGENPPWLELMAVDAIKDGDANGFINGFACDEIAARKWLKENKL